MSGAIFDAHGLVQGGVRQRHPVEPRQRVDRVFLALAPLAVAAALAWLGDRQAREGREHGRIAQATATHKDEGNGERGANRRSSASRGRCAPGRIRCSVSPGAAAGRVDRRCQGDAGQARAARRAREDGHRAARHAGSGRPVGARRSVDAIDLSRIPALLELVENGKVALPFEIDPAAWPRCSDATIPSRSSCASRARTIREVWKTLEGLGIGTLRGAGGTRAGVRQHLSRRAMLRGGLSDEEFAAVLAFTRGGVRFGAGVSRLEVASATQGSAAKAQVLKRHGQRAIGALPMRNLQLNPATPTTTASTE